jgi:hypothetical protein
MRDGSFHAYTNRLSPEDREAFLEAMSRPWLHWAKLVWWSLGLGLCAFILLLFALVL